jgi:hypothetical protein
MPEYKILHNHFSENMRSSLMMMHMWCFQRCMKDYNALSGVVGACGTVVVKTLCYKPEGRGFETRWGEWIFFNLLNPSGRIRPWGLLSL